MPLPAMCETWRARSGGGGPNQSNKQNQNQNQNQNAVAQLSQQELSDSTSATN